MEKMTMKKYRKNANGNNIKDTLHDLVQLMIDEMENGTGEWVKSWSAPNGFPQNMVSKKHYRGFNSIHLSMVASRKGYVAPYWLTFNQVKELGGMVKKGEKSTDIFFYKFLDKSKTIKDEETGEELVNLKHIPLLRMYKVFNIEQTEGIEYELPEPNINNNERYINAEDFIQSTKADIRYGGDRAFYRPSDDFIQVPEIQFFTDSDNYYATLLHELTHWTGHDTRLDRDKHSRWGDNTYAFEELIAELGAVFLCSHLGISIEKNRHPEYLQGWVRSLREDPQILWRAASKAQEAFDYVVKAAENNSKYTVWVGGTEVTDQYLDKSKAEEIAQSYIANGYDDVQIAVA